MLSAKGRNGQVTVDDAFVTISRKGALAKMTQGFTKGDKRIPIRSITAVQFKASGMTAGYIQFALGGSQESKGGVRDATKDENSVLFGGGAQGDFEAIRDHVEAVIAGSGAPAPTVGGGLADELKKLSDLRDQGILSDAEFDAQKAKLLG